MAREQKADHTNIYRFKVTATGVHQRDGYGKVKGQIFQDIKFIGPYTRKVPFQSWIPSDCDVKVERQQLIAQYDDSIDEAFLMWDTIETKYYEKGGRVDS
jgi:hypothetical protein